MNIKEEFRDFLNESEYKKAVNWFKQECERLKITTKKPVENKTPTKVKFTTFYIIKDINVGKIQQQITKRFPDLNTTISSVDNTIDIYEN